VIRRIIDLLANELRTSDFEANEIRSKSFLIWIHVKEIEKYYKEITLNKVIKKGC